MNKYEELFREIFISTKNGLMQWKQTKRDSNYEIVFSPNTVFRQFVSTLRRGDTEYKVLLLEKKFDDPEHDFAYQRYAPEVLIVDEGELIASLTDSVIDRSDLVSLAGIVESRSDKARKLFGGGV